MKVIGDGISGKGARALLEVVGNDLPDDLVIISPGAKPIAGAIGEAELAMRFVKQPVIGITGTNGKTTLTLLVAHILDGVALGNVGRSLCEYLVNPQDEIIVAELSSFQLETMSTRALDVAVITNITPDHLDRYESFEEYGKAKWRIADCVKEGGKVITTKAVADVWNKTCEVVEDSLEAFALAICSHFGVQPKEALAKIATFTRPPHRLEFVGERDGIAFYNDSKATNIAAVLYALSKMKRPVILLAGGRHKGGSFAPLDKKAKHVIAFGEAASQIEEEVSGVLRADSLEEAVLEGQRLAKKGDVILLSPGCASFDMFENFEHRGERFKELVQ